ncbi:hypothetical protein PG993_008762 [Apiospora rasikravindrae]|uniref:Uncharacterized protein n=1 Tax=Apiospora rasikravindrae TaxID=990691 RepID=A0ABR1SP90_9PEZI
MDKRQLLHHIIFRNCYHNLTVVFIICIAVILCHIDVAFTEFIDATYTDNIINTETRGSESQHALEDTGILELEADLAPPEAAAGKPGVYELEAVEKPLELRASVATWLSRRTGRASSLGGRNPT